MPDLRDGESVEMQGSAARPYVLKNLGGVYSCSCPAWRNQSLPIEHRTCKHLRGLRGDTAEEARVGSGLAPRTREPSSKAEAPPLLLAETWDGQVDPTGWLLSEKLDGVRAYFDGKRFLSRQGNRYHAPAWFTAGLPNVPLDGELWLGRKQFQRTVSIVRRQDQTDLWKEVRFMIFDVPAFDDPFEKRLRLATSMLQRNRPPYAALHEHVACRGLDHLQQELARVEALGGEGLMLRQPGSNYEIGRSGTLLKAKRFRDGDARVLGHEPGRGRHQGRLGALLVEIADGTRFAVGTGFSDAQRSSPPPVGSLIRFRYQELSDAGVPRFPSFVSLHEDMPTISKQGEPQMPKASVKRRLEFVGGASAKFWEIAVEGKTVRVRFGRLGASGQQETKEFATAEAAAKHADKRIREKLNKGYALVG